MNGALGSQLSALYQRRLAQSQHHCCPRTAAQLLVSPTLLSTCRRRWPTTMPPQSSARGARAGPLFHRQNRTRIVPPQSRPWHRTLSVGSDQSGSPLFGHPRWCFQHHVNILLMEHPLWGSDQCTSTLCERLHGGGSIHSLRSAP